MKTNMESKLSVFGDAWTFDSMLENRNHRKFNEVFLVKHRLSGIRGVCKYLEKTVQNQHLWNLLQHEAQLSFVAKGLPQTLAFDENETSIVLIRNFQPGVPLNEYWQKIPKKAQVDFIRKMIEQLVPIFNELKQKGIVHCDVKPTNLIVAGTLESPEISLIDFGMSVRLQELPERKTLFALGYSAPELILNKLHLLDHSSDIFALGISIWQLFTGKLPLTHPNPSIMTNLQITHPLPENRMIPKETFPVLQKMCVKHSFRKPPNLLSDSEVEIQLKTAMEQRFQDLGSVLLALNERQKTSWIGKLFGK